MNPQVFNIQYYMSPLGRILLSSDGTALTGAWFEGQKYFPPLNGGNLPEKKDEVLSLTGSWLDRYFSGRRPDFMPPVFFTGSVFQMTVWQLLMQIPYGETVTYGELGKIIARQTGKEIMSARAVGNAVGRNKISIIVPCHRVIGADGSLTGYAGGTERKSALLALEKTGRLWNIPK